MASKIGYMCKVDYEYHLEHDCNGSEVYPSLKSLKAHVPCIKDCGYVKIQINLVSEK